MWKYQIFLKDGELKAFLTDSPYVPDEYVRYYNAHLKNIDCVFCDHFPETAEEWLSDNPDDYAKISEEVWESN